MTGTSLGHYRIVEKIGAGGKTQTGIAAPRALRLELAGGRSPGGTDDRPRVLPRRRSSGVCSNPGWRPADLPARSVRASGLAHSRNRRRPAAFLFSRRGVARLLCRRQAEESLSPRRTVAKDGDIWVLPLEGERKPEPFLQTSADEGGATLSPDGRFLAYVSNESGRAEVYVRAFPGPGGNGRPRPKAGRSRYGPRTGVSSSTAAATR
jgi:hypothetical protein